MDAETKFKVVFLFLAMLVAVPITFASFEREWRAEFTKPHDAKVIELYTVNDRQLGPNGAATVTKYWVKWMDNGGFTSALLDRSAWSELRIGGSIRVVTANGESHPAAVAPSTHVWLELFLLCVENCVLLGYALVFLHKWRARRVRLGGRVRGPV